MLQDSRTVEHPKTLGSKEMMLQRSNGEIKLFGVRGIITNPVAACEKIDQLFGSGGEAIVHYMWFEQGRQLFDTMRKYLPNETRGKLLKLLIDIQPRTGWGMATVKIKSIHPPEVEIIVKNPPIKTLKGSQKHIMGSFWAGALSEYFNRELECKTFSYDAEMDTFFCRVKS